MFLDWRRQMMKQKKSILIITFVTLAGIVFSSCGAAAPSEPTQDPNAVFTQVAETVMVSMTQTAAVLPPTPMPQPTAAMEQPTIAPTDALPTQPPAPTIPAGPTATVPRVGDSAKWASNNPADGAVFGADEQFQMTACFINNGTTTWTEEYYLTFAAGTRLCYDIDKFYVGEEIEPGGKWCFTIPAVTPEEFGSYITRWHMKNPSGVYMEEDYFPFTVQ